MAGGYKLTYGKVPVSRETFFDCCCTIEDWDLPYITQKIEHIREVHRYLGLEQQEYERIRGDLSHLSDEEIRQLASDNLLYTGYGLFSVLLPEDFEYTCQTKLSPDGEPVRITLGVMISGTHGKVSLGSSSGSLIHHLAKDYSNRKALNFVTNYYRFINLWATREGFSVGLEDCIPKNTDLIDQEFDKRFIEAKVTMENEKDPDIQETKIQIALNNATQIGENIAKKSLDRTNNFVTMVFSGAKGDMFNICSITSAIGQQNVDGVRVPKTCRGRTLPHYPRSSIFTNCPDIVPTEYTKLSDAETMGKLFESRGLVRSSYFKGLNSREYFFSSASGREGLIETAVKTSTVGYLARQLMKKLEDLKVSYFSTIVDARNKIVQFSYGNDNYEPAKLIKTNHGYQCCDVSHIISKLNAQREWANKS